MVLAESKMIKNGVLAMKFEEWWNEKALRYFAIIRENGSMSAERVVDLEQSCKTLACIAWRAAQPKWQPMETAPKYEPILTLMKYGILEGEWDGDVARGYYWREMEWYPTHWMPLPEPPEVEK